VKGEHQLRDLIKGKNGEIDLAAESLAYQGYITNELAGKGKAWRNAITEAGRAHLDELGHDKPACPNAGHASYTTCSVPHPMPL
jgi:hypothetical protein